MHPTKTRFSTISAPNSILRRSNKLETRSFRRTSSMSFPAGGGRFRPPPAALLRRRRRDRRPVSLTSETWNNCVPCLRALCARVKNKRYTLAVSPSSRRRTASSVLAEFLGILDDLDLEVKAVFLDREFYDSKRLTLLQAHNHAYVMPIVRWGRTIKQELSEGWSRVIQHDMTAKLDGHSWTVEFPVYIDCTYQNGRYDEHGVARHGYAADAPFIDSPRDARYHYAKRFGIEASYRLSEQSIATTSTQNPVVQLLYVVVSLLLQNVWRYLHWEYVATPRRGGRRLWQWPFKEFINMIQRAAWTALATRRAVPANRPPDDRFTR